ncbi:MAG: 30S ribosomal protein S3 [Dehalococcoidia bacterium]|nr:30S ribosomal protein S3 [Dehalococcoidia bacterium]
MGQKTHPIGFRLGIIKGGRTWDSSWFASKSENYKQFVEEDLKIRSLLRVNYQDAGISKINIERGAELVVTLHTARPGIVIGRGGTRIDQLREEIEKMTGKISKVNVYEVKQPELDASLLARNVADQLEHRVMFRRAMRQASTRAMQSGAEGIKILCSGRLGGAEIARKEKVMVGRVPLHTLRAEIDYGVAEANTTFGKIGIKVWIFKGEITDTENNNDSDLGPIGFTLQSNVPSDENEEQQTEASLEEGNVTTTEN